MMPAFIQRSVRVVAVVLAMIKIWLVSAQPLLAVGPSPHDDRLFLRLANTFLDGQWLGAYNHFTLIKGPAYSIFIAGTVAIGIPLPLAQHLLYLLACWLVVRALRPLLPDDRWALGLFFILLWQPMSFEGPTFARVMRQNFYTPCAMLVFAGLAALHTRADSRRRVRVGWAVLLGLSWGTLWLTREESIWIVPGTIMLAAVAIVLASRGSVPAVAGLVEAGPGSTTPATTATARLWRVLFPMALAAATAALPIGLVCAMNARNYGWWGTVEFRAPRFIAAYGALSRIEVGPQHPFLPLSRAGREAAYGVSPAFAELRPWLEGQVGDAYAKIAADFHSFDPAQREVAGWWMWALRDAVHAAGHAPDAGTALAFYQRLADEINAACDRGVIPAGPPRATLVPRWRSEYTRAAWRGLPEYLGSLAFFSYFDAHVPPSVGDAGSLRLFRDLTQWHLSPAPEAPVFDTPTGTIARGYRVDALDLVGRILRWVCAAVVISGAVAWFTGVVRAVRRRVAPSYRWWFAAGLLGSAFVVVVLNLLVNVSSFPRFGPMALAQAYPLVLLFGVVAWVDVIAEHPRRAPANLPHRAKGPARE